MTKIIAFEGIDGTGKSVQMQRLQDTLTRRGLKVGALSFPAYESFFGSYVGRYLTGRDGVPASEVDQKSMALWFALDRWETFKTFSYSQYDVLLINRYVLSNAVYQSIRDRDLGKEELLSFVLELEYGHFKIPRPDLQLILDVAPKDASDNVDKKGFREYAGDGKDVYEAQESLQQRARRKYKEYAKRLSDARVIPCMKEGALLPIEDVAALVLLEAEKIL